MLLRNLLQFFSISISCWFLQFIVCSLLSGQFKLWEIQQNDHSTWWFPSNKSIRKESRVIILSRLQLVRIKYTHAFGEHSLWSKIFDMIIISFIESQKTENKRNDNAPNMGVMQDLMIPINWLVLYRNGNNFGWTTLNDIDQFPLRYIIEVANNNSIMCWITLSYALVLASNLVSVV